MKNPDGTYMHFEMKGGIYEGWIHNLIELSARIDGCVNSFQAMSKEEIDGTTVALCLFCLLEKEVDRLKEQMEGFRKNATFNRT